mgnify:FL=1
MKNRPERVIIDTNLWISFLISHNYTELDEILIKRECVLIFGDELLEEFLTVIKRPKFKNFFSLEDTINLIETIQDYAEFIEVTTQVNVCRDNKDNFLLSLAKDSNADFLLTGDRDLLVLKKIGSTRIITITDFLNRSYR